MLEIDIVMTIKRNLRNNLSNKPKRQRNLSEIKLRSIIQEELTREYLIREGMWDDVKDGVKKLSSYVTKQFKQVSATWAKAIIEKINQLGSIPDGVKKIFGLLKNAMSSSGESLSLDEGLKAAQELGKFNVATAISAVESDLEGSVKERASQIQKGKTESKQLVSLYRILAETNYTSSSLKRPRERLNEDFGITAILGVGLAVMGGLPMLFKGLSQLAEKLGAHKANQMFEKAEKVCHHFEQKVIEGVIPDKVAFVVYKGLFEMGIKLTKSKEAYNEIEIKAEADGIAAIKKTKNLIYKVLLIYFAWNGLKGVLHAGASLIGFIEGAATTVKGVELAKGAVEIAKLV